MFLRSFKFSVVAGLLFALAACQQNAPVQNNTESPLADTDRQWNTAKRSDAATTIGNIVVANRASGTISVIDVRTDEVTGTYALPGAQQAQPMYVVYERKMDRVFVGDRANDQVVVFDANNFSVIKTIQTGQGVFHMWGDPQGKELWVNNDISNTVTVIDVHSLSIKGTINLPADLVAMGGKPHDVILDAKGPLAFVTMLGFSGEHDYVVQYDRRTMQETARAAVGKDPHLSLTQKNDLLYVPCQNSNAVYILNRLSLEVEDILDIPGAHGAGMDLRGRTFYTTNLTGGGSAGLWAIDVRTNQVIGKTDTPFPVPHNIAVTADGKKLYVTHSGGTSDKVSVYRITPGQQVPVYTGSVTVGFNPFGLAFAL